MRALFLVPVLVLPLLAGCDAILRHNGDYFDAGADIGRFQQDDQACSSQARDYVSYTLRGMDGTGYDRNRAFNDVYSRCMNGRGYAARAYARNWLPQT